MKKSLLAGALFTVLFSSATYAHGSCDDTALHGYMQDIKNDLRGLSSEVKAGDNQAASQYLEGLISAFEKSRDVRPHQFEMEGLKGQALHDASQEYVALIDETLKTLDDLGAALAANDTSSIRQLLGEMGQHRKTGHRAFKGSC
ncbi:cytochrome b562 [Marinomonas sp. THO17]|uniref:cytochrome b562 n=1 Tax=Marinomonas sp. THO17 TaxID=3149048 RepID=UPI00336C1A9C